MDGKYGPTKPFKVHEALRFVASVKDDDPLADTLCLKFENPPPEHQNESKSVLSMYLPTGKRLGITRTGLDDEVCRYSLPLRMAIEKYRLFYSDGGYVAEVCYPADGQENNVAKSWT
eukprot:1150513_1